MAAPPQRNVTVFKSKEELEYAMAKYTAELSVKFCKEKGRFLVVLSGGDLISWLCKLLESPYLDSIEWTKWHIFWVDERVCKRTDADSNYRLAVEGFLNKVGVPKEQIYGIDDSYAEVLTSEHCAELYEQCLKNLVDKKIIPLSPTGYPQFDLELLGMGPDGHMASLFPGHDEIKVTDKWVTYINDSPKPPKMRFTFTLPVINSALYNLMAVCDPPQAHSIAKIIKHNDMSLPSAHLTAQVECVWYLDPTAAAEL